MIVDQVAPHLDFTNARGNAQRNRSAVGRTSQLGATADTLNDNHRVFDLKLTPMGLAAIDADFPRPSRKICLAML